MRRFRTILAVLVALAIGGGGAWTYFDPPVDVPLPASLAPWVGAPLTTAEGYLVAEVERVVDGDTLVVRIGSETERVRLLNVDTPESVHPDDSRNTVLGARAADYTRRRLENAQVRLEAGGDESHDRYGRRLAYVLVDGRNFNIELVREGWSEYVTKYGASERYDREFRTAEKEARKAERGIWEEEGGGWFW